MPDSKTSVVDYLKSLPLYVLPHHAISRLVYALTRVRSPLKNPFMRWFIHHFRVDMTEALESNPRAYASFNEFFTRAIRPELRPLAKAPEVVASPVDATVSQAAPIEAGRLIQAKGHDYSVLELLGGSDSLANEFAGGSFTTLYLSPRDYHRIHMPVDGTLRRMTYVPGRLFSVAPHTVRTIPRLFARNERVVTVFDTPLGAMAMVLVGAINVAAIETVWAGLVTPPHGRRISNSRYGEDRPAPYLRKGEEMGRFNMGSTVILLFADSGVNWSDDLVPGAAVRMGHEIGRGPAGE
ncbi:MAG TPA: phosphatidylserine decarboxylase [Thioalkalivibrio sp.]|nr:phosphatidylserine decarboxylase [Thioalkalivibrio sp.]